MPVFLITLLITLFLANNSFSADLNPTQYILKGQVAPFNGFVVEQDRLQMCVRAVQDADYYKSLSDMQKQYYEEKMVADAKIAELTLQLKTKEDAAVEKGLKEELVKKSVWYKQYWVTIPATVVSMFLLRIPLAP